MRLKRHWRGGWLPQGSKQRQPVQTDPKRGLIYTSQMYLSQRKLNEAIPIFLALSAASPDDLSKVEINAVQCLIEATQAPGKGDSCEQAANVILNRRRYHTAHVLSLRQS